MIEDLRDTKWLVTGAAGFIGSQLVAALLQKNAYVIALDNLSRGTDWRIQNILNQIRPDQRQKFEFRREDILSFSTLSEITKGVDYVLHQAALASVPESFKDPRKTHEINLTGTMNVFEAAASAQVKKVVFASTSAVYGARAAQSINIETDITSPLSPYALSKYLCEVYGEYYSRTRGLNNVALRYFNVFGPGMSTESGYAAVLPLWFQSLLKNENILIYGDGLATRDFCHIDTIVKANISVAVEEKIKGFDCLNVASGKSISIQELAECTLSVVRDLKPEIVRNQKIIYSATRVGDVKNSEAAVEKIKKFIDLPVVTKERLCDQIRTAFLDFYKRA